MSRPLGFYVPYHEDDGAKGDYAEILNMAQFIPLTAIETIYQVNGGYWKLRTLSGNTYSFGAMDESGVPYVPVIDKLTGVADAEEMEKHRREKVVNHDYNRQ